MGAVELRKDGRDGVMRQIIGKVVCTYIYVFRAYVEAKMGCGVGAEGVCFLHEGSQILLILGRVCLGSDDEIIEVV